MATAFGVGELIKAIKLQPQLGAYLLALKHLQVQSLFADSVAFAAQAFPFAATECRQKIVERPKPLIEPVKLGGNALV